MLMNLGGEKKGRKENSKTSSGETSKPDLIKITVLSKQPEGTQKR